MTNINARSAILGATLTAAMIAIAACSSSTSSNVSIDTDDIQYVKDTRTGMCFAFVGSGKTISTKTTGLAMSRVPCNDKVRSLINR